MIFSADFLKFVDRGYGQCLKKKDYIQDFKNLGQNVIFNNDYSKDREVRLLIEAFYFKTGILLPYTKNKEALYPIVLNHFNIDQWDKCHTFEEIMKIISN